MAARAIRALAATLALLVAAPAPGLAQQDRTLADIRQELSVLYVELQRLKRELSTTGTPGVAVGGATALERMDRIEAELQRLTAQTERMELRIDRVVQDGTNRVGDLEFRLCELEPGCDIASLGETPMLGGAADSPAALPDPAAPGIPAGPGDDTAGGGELAMSEQTDFDAARAAYDSGDYARAADLFGDFTATYPGGPLNSEAHFLRGEALSAQGQTAPAARAYLEAFSGSPTGSRAADALLKLGISLGDLGQTDEACVMLRQVGDRFPGTGQAQGADQQALALGCP